MKNLPKILIGIVILVLVIIAVAFIAVNGNSKTKEVKLNGDVIPTVYSVVGDVKLVGIATGTTSDGPYKTYTYNTSDFNEDLIVKYVEALRKENYAIITSEGYNVVLANDSKDVGKVLMVSISIYNDEVIIKYTKITETLTRY